MTKVLNIIILAWVSSLFGKDLPSWVTSPYDYCSSEYLCAVGEGTGKLVAEASARSELAKVFKVDIKSSSSFETTETSITNQEEMKGSTKSDSLSFLKESVDELLEGVEITQVHQTDEGFFALARLDKKSASDRLRKQMGSLDTQISSLMDEGKRSSFFKALKNFRNRELINQRFHILNERYEKGLWSEKRILMAIDGKKRKEIKVGLSFNEVPQDFSYLVLENLLALGYRVRTDKVSLYPFRIKMDFKKSKQHMNVKGFEKWKFSLHLVSHSKEGTQIGQKSFDLIQVGRSYQQCYSQALKEFNKELENNLGELTID